MATRRIPQQKDSTIIGEGIPMLSASQREIRVGELLYETCLETSYGRGDTKKWKFMVTPHRVIQLNFKHRYIRIRCANACEATVHYGNDKCSRVKYWHSLEEAKAEIAERIEKQMHEEDEEISKHLERKNGLTALKKELRGYKLTKLPAEVMGAS